MQLFQSMKKWGNRAPEILWHIKPPFRTQKFFLHRYAALWRQETQSLDFAYILEKKQHPFFTISKHWRKKTLFLSPAQNFPQYIVLGRDYSERVQVEFNPAYKIQDVSSFPSSRFTWNPFTTVTGTTFHKNFQDGRALDLSSRQKRQETHQCLRCKSSATLMTTTDYLRSSEK